jgi:hypothetical protein
VSAPAARGQSANFTSVYSVAAPHNNTKAKAKGKGTTKGGKGETGKGGANAKTHTGGGGGGGSSTAAANNGWGGYEDVNTTGYHAMTPDRAPPVNTVATYGRTSNGGGGVGGEGGGTTSSDGYEVAQIGQRQGGTGASMQSSAPPPAISRGRKQQASGVYGFDSGGNEEDV